MKKLLVIGLGAVVLTGCTVVPGVVQDKTKPIEQGGYSVVGDEVTASESQVYLLGIPLSDLRGSAGRRMYKKALKQAPGADALIEYCCDYKTINLGIATFQRYRLTGTPVKTNK